MTNAVAKPASTGVALARIQGTCTRTSWQPPANGLTAEQCIDIGRAFRSAEVGSPWWLGDLMIYAAARGYGEGKEIAKQIGANWRTMQTYASVCRAFKRSNRFERLGFRHHAMVASKSPEERQRWLEDAARNQWTVRDLEDALGRTIEHEAPEPEVVKTKGAKRSIGGKRAKARKAGKQSKPTKRRQADILVKIEDAFMQFYTREIGDEYVDIMCELLPNLKERIAECDQATNGKDRSAPDDEWSERQ